MAMLYEYNDDDNPFSVLSLERLAHFGDPCIFCGTPHDKVEPGPCPYLLECERQIAKSDRVVEDDENGEEL